MAGQKNDDRISSPQRKALVTLAVEVLDRKIQQARDESGELVAQIRNQVREELGVVAIDMEIKSMEERIRVLERKREELGFDKYQDRLLPGSGAKTLVNQRSSSACEKVRELEDMKMDSISGIWTASTMSQALSIFNNIRGLQL